MTNQSNDYASKIELLNELFYDFSLFLMLRYELQRSQFIDQSQYDLQKEEYQFIEGPELIRHLYLNEPNKLIVLIDYWINTERRETYGVGRSIDQGQAIKLKNSFHLAVAEFHKKYSDFLVKMRNDYYAIKGISFSDKAIFIESEIIDSETLPELRKKRMKTYPNKKGNLLIALRLLYAITHSIKTKGDKIEIKKEDISLEHYSSFPDHFRFLNAKSGTKYKNIDDTYYSLLERLLNLCKRKGTCTINEGKVIIEAE